jgi:hypothetical protein
MNAVAQSTLAGELTEISHQLLIGVNTDEGMTDESMKNLSTCQGKLVPGCDSQTMRTVDVDACPISSINRVSWNQTARGYHCGLMGYRACKRCTANPSRRLWHGKRKLTALLNDDSENWSETACAGFVSFVLQFHS